MTFWIKFWSKNNEKKPNAVNNLRCLEVVFDFYTHEMCMYFSVLYEMTWNWYDKISHYVYFSRFMLTKINKQYSELN